MSIRQRLRSVIESRQANQICWCCALESPRYGSTAPSRVQEGPYAGECFTVRREKAPTDFSLSGAVKLQIRKHVSNKGFTEPAQGQLRKKIEQSRDEIVDAAQRALFSDKEAIDGRKLNTGPNNLLNQAKSNLTHKEQSPNVRRHPNFSYEGQFRRIRKYTIPSTRLTVSGLKWNGEQERSSVGLQAHASAPHDGRPVNQDIITINQENQARVLDGNYRRRLRSPKSNRARLWNYHDQVAPYLAQEMMLRNAKLNAGSAERLVAQKRGANSLIVRRIYGLRKLRPITQGRRTTVMATEHSKERKQDSSQSENFRFGSLTGVNKLSIRKHLAMQESDELHESKTATPQYAHMSPRSSTETAALVGDDVRRRDWRAGLVGTSIGTPKQIDVRGGVKDQRTKYSETRKTAGIAGKRSKPLVRIRQVETERRNIVVPPIRHVRIERKTSIDPYIRQDELDSVLERLKHTPEPSPATSATRLAMSPSRISPSSCEGQYQFRRKMESAFNFLPKTYAKTAVGHRPERFASTLARQFADVSIRPPLAAVSINIPNGYTDCEGIRKRLKEWKATQGNDLRSGPSIHADSQFSSNVTMNTITQSGGDDESYTDSALDDGLDAERQFNTVPEDSVLEIINPQVFLRRGDLVELNVGGAPVLAILISQANDIAHFYTERGTWHQRRTGVVQFSIPHVVSPHELTDLLPYLSIQKIDLEMVNKPLNMSNVPRDIGYPLIERMAHILQVSDAVFRKHAERLNRAHEILSQGENESQTSISLEDAAIRILQKNTILDLTPPMLLIVHRTLNRSQNIFQKRQLHRMNPKFEVLPRATLTKLDAVTEWIREYQDDIVKNATNSLLGVDGCSIEASTNPLATFVAKARRIVTSSRQNRPLSSIGFIGTSSTKVKLDESNLTTWGVSEEHQETFDHNEQQLISFLDAWVASSHLNKASYFSSLGPMILRAVGMYNGMALDQSTGFTLLQELGSVKPWERPSLSKTQLRLPGHDPLHPATILRNQAHESLARLSFPFQDSMAGFRKDWGDLTVFCIDGPDTLERDDGISLEPVAGAESLCWIHVHVANPSAFLDKDSPIARYARHAGASVYFPEHVYPMMEARLSQEHFSLANGRRCITFSAKISTEGDIIEKSITHGILNDVRYVTLQQVKQALGSSGHEAVEEDRVSLIQVGGDFLPLRSQRPTTRPEAMETLDNSNIDDLRKLHKVSQAIKSRRLRAGAFSFNQPDHSETVPNVYISRDESQTSTLHAHRSRHIIGDPIISIDQVYRVLSEVQDMVAEFMILAGHICAMWCSERNMPVPYRGIVRNPDPSPSPETYRELVLDPIIASQGHADISKWLTYMALIGATYASSRPLEHIALGLPAYCKATSPLRRYGDLFGHWQIEAAIRHEYATGESLVGSSSATYDTTSVLPFSRSEVEDVARSVFAREKQILAADREAHNHWTVQALHRAFYFDEAPLPQMFEIAVRTVTEDLPQTTWGILTGWDTSAVIRRGEASDKEGGYRIHDIWEGRLFQVLPHRGLVVLEPVRLIRRAEGR